jgi:hypothetical protein
VRSKAAISKRVRPSRRARSPIVEVAKSREQLEVWLCDDGARQLAGSVGLDLVSDAERLGQDLVGRLVEKALREADRRSMAS